MQVLELSSDEHGLGQLQELPDGFPQHHAPELTRAERGLPLQLDSIHIQVSAFEGSGGGSDEADRAQMVQGRGMADNEILPTCSTRMFPTMGIMQSNEYTTDGADLADIAVTGTLPNKSTTRISTERAW